MKRTVIEVTVTVERYKQPAIFQEGNWITHEQYVAPAVRTAKRVRLTAGKDRGKVFDASSGQEIVARRRGFGFRFRYSVTPTVPEARKL